MSTGVALMRQYWGLEGRIVTGMWDCCNAIVVGNAMVELV